MSWDTSFLHFKNSVGSDSLKSAAKRQKSFDKFLLRGLPATQEEYWKYTSLSQFKKIEWGLHTEEEVALSHEQMQEISKNLPADFLNFVFVNGQLNKTLSDEAEDLMSMAELTDSDFEFDERNSEEKLLNLSQAFLAKKICINISKHKTIEKPVQILFVQSSAQSVYISEKLDIHLDENSEVKLLINSISFVNSTPDAMNLNIKVNLENSSRLTFIQLQNEDLQSYHFSQVRINIKSTAKLVSLPLSLGNLLSRNHLHLQLNGYGSEVEAYGLSILNRNQHCDNYTFVQHTTGGNHSKQHYKSILSDESRSVFRGRVLIEPNAQKANSEQLNNNLLLTRQAQVDTVPQLEIFADDVKAGHGATVGQLNKDEIFYFLSRGINQYEAVKMLSYGFAKEIIYKIEDKDLQKYLIAVIEKKLASLVQNA